MIFTLIAYSAAFAMRVLVNHGFPGPPLKRGFCGSGSLVGCTLIELQYSQQATPFTVCLCPTW